MNKSNVTKKAFQPMFECPICMKYVSEDNLIHSFRLIEEGNVSSMRVLILCRECRDSGI